MIQEEYVSFEIAKLLKEKGFDVSCRFAYTNSGCGFNTSVCCDVPVYAYKPTLQMAMKWLREEKHIYIQVMLDSWACGDHSGYYIVIQKTDSDFELMLGDVLDEVFFQTYEEAAEAAIKYCLEKII